jgi:hypothetical protein
MINIANAFTPGRLLPPVYFLFQSLPLKLALCPLMLARNQLAFGLEQLFLNVCLLRLCFNKLLALISEHLPLPRYNLLQVIRLINHPLQLGLNLKQLCVFRTNFLLKLTDPPISLFLPLFENTMHLGYLFVHSFFKYEQFIIPFLQF